MRGFAVLCCSQISHSERVQLALVALNALHVNYSAFLARRASALASLGTDDWAASAASSAGAAAAGAAGAAGPASAAAAKVETVVMDAETADADDDADESDGSAAGSASASGSSATASLAWPSSFEYFASAGSVGSEQRWAASLPDWLDLDLARAARPAEAETRGAVLDAASAQRETAFFASLYDARAGRMHGPSGGSGGDDSGASAAFALDEDDMLEWRPASSAAADRKLWELATQQYVRMHPL